MSDEIQNGTEAAEKRKARNQKVGIVTSDKMDKSCTVRVDRLVLARGSRNHDPRLAVRRSQLDEPVVHRLVVVVEPAADDQERAPQARICRSAARARADHC